MKKIQKVAILNNQDLMFPILRIREKWLMEYWSMLLEVIMVWNSYKDLSLSCPNCLENDPNYTRYGFPITREKHF